jgi:hypothetical protein
MVDSTMAVGGDVVAAAYNAEAELSEKMSRREMRRMGLTVLNVRRRARQMAIAGEITADMPHEQIRDIVIDDLMGEEPGAWMNVGAPDWDSIIAFITQLLPLILQLLAIFGI